MEIWQRAFILHNRPWSETSLILDVFTEETGRVHLIAKGIRSKRSILKGILQPFTPLLVHFKGRGEIKTLYNAEAVSCAFPLSGISLYSGLYVNELISRVLQYEIQFSKLFFSYLDCLQALTIVADSLEPALRKFELSLLEQLGYGVDFLHCANSGKAISNTMTYRYQEEKGFIASTVIDNNTFIGRHLRDFSKKKFLDIDTLRAAKRFTRIAMKPYLGNKILKSAELFRKFI